MRVARAAAVVPGDVKGTGGRIEGELRRRIGGDAAGVVAEFRACPHLAVGGGDRDVPFAVATAARVRDVDPLARGIDLDLRRAEVVRDALAGAIDELWLAEPAAVRGRGEQDVVIAGAVRSAHPAFERYE